MLVSTLYSLFVIRGIMDKLEKESNVKEIKEEK